MTLAAEPTQPLRWALAALGSAAVHVGVIFGVFGTFQDLLPEPEAPAEPIAFTVTSISLEPDQIDGFETLNSPGAEPETIAPDPAPEKELAALQPVTPAVPEALRPAPVTVQAAQVLSPIRAETGAAAVAQPVETAAIPTLQADPASPDPTVIEPGQPQSITPVETALLAPPDPFSNPTPAPELSPEELAQAAALDDLMARIRREGGTDCLIALPQLTSDAQVRLLLIGDRIDAMDASAEAILAGIEVLPIRDNVLIDPRQCAALDFVRSIPDYPALQISLGLTGDAIASGARLTGSIRRVGNREATLLLVDDNGVVQDLERFMTYGAGVIWFDVPMTRDTEERGASQLLIALATPAPSQVIEESAGLLAENIFPSLTTEFSPAPAVALVPFDVR